MAFLTKEQLDSLGFKHVGHNVKISDKASIYTPEKISIGDNTVISDFSVISGSVEIGRNVYIAVGCIIQGANYGVSIGNFAELAAYSHLFAAADDQSGEYISNPTVPDEFKNVIGNAISIGRHAVIGAKAIVYPGVDIGEGAVVSAYVIQMQDAESWGVYFGNPSEKVKTRSKALLKLEKKYLSQEAS